MFTAEFAGRSAGLLEQLDSVLTALAELDLSVGGGADLLELLSGMERRVRRFASVDHALIAESTTGGARASVQLREHRRLPLPAAGYRRRPIVLL
jgi:hypothetical protein